LIVVAQVRRDILRIGLFAGLFFSRFSKPNTGATAVLVDELDAGTFERALDYLQRRAAWRARSGFQLVNRNDTDTGFTSKILLAPR
jgi:hypothetical protein